MLTRPTLLLRLEGLALLATAVTLYALLGLSWWLFALLLFTPDLAMLGYLRGPRPGAASYNLVHTTTPPLLVALAAFWSGGETLWTVSLVWLAHIGLDRALGYGLKHPSSFGDSHLGSVGRKSAAR